MVPFVIQTNFYTQFNFTISMFSGLSAQQTATLQGRVDLENSNGCSYTRKASSGRQFGVTKQTIIMMMSLRISLRLQTVASRAVVWPQVTIYLSQWPLKNICSWYARISNWHPWAWRFHLIVRNQLSPFIIHCIVTLYRDWDFLKSIMLL